MLVCTDITWSIAAWQVVGDGPPPGAPVGCVDMYAIAVATVVGATVELGLAVSLALAEELWVAG
jgi:hypothetical protein